jgi:Protein of unknown function (DUF3570).
MHYTDKSHNQSVNFGLSYAFNEILSYNYDTGSGASKKEDSNSLNIQAGINQVINDHSAMKVEAFTILDDGYLTNPHANVVRDYKTSNQRLVTENLSQIQQQPMVLI